jgi:hypothetical protein
VSHRHCHRPLECRIQLLQQRQCLFVPKVSGSAQSLQQCLVFFDGVCQDAPDGKPVYGSLEALERRVPFYGLALPHVRDGLVEILLLLKLHSRLVCFTEKLPCVLEAQGLNVLVKVNQDRRRQGLERLFLQLRQKLRQAMDLK